MDEKIKVLIGVATAFVAKCKPWFSHFLNQAQKIGISNQEIIEAVNKIFQIVLIMNKKLITRKKI